MIAGSVQENWNILYNKALEQISVFVTVLAIVRKCGTICVRKQEAVPNRRCRPQKQLSLALYGEREREEKFRLISTNLGNVLIFEILKREFLLMLGKSLVLRGS